MGSPLHTHRELCTERQPFCTCSASHSLSCNCKKPAQCSCELPRVAWSSKVCTVLLQSLTNPSWLVEGALVLAAVSNSTHVHLDTLPS